MQIAILISSLLIIFGAGCAVLAIKHHRRALYLFFAAFCLQLGIFVLLNALNIISLGFPDAWPLLPIFTGAALIVAGRHRYGAFRANYIVLSAAFIVLGAIMTVFALDILSFTLMQFARDWWALLVLLPGLTLILISLSARYARKIRR